jgi:hypothetical protein
MTKSKVFRPDVNRSVKLAELDGVNQLIEAATARARQLEAELGIVAGSYTETSALSAVTRISTPMKSAKGAGLQSVRASKTTPLVTAQTNKKAVEAEPVAKKPDGRSRQMSQEQRDSISKAQKERWSATHNRKGKTAPLPPPPAAPSLPPAPPNVEKVNDIVSREEDSGAHLSEFIVRPGEVMH